LTIGSPEPWAPFLTDLDRRHLDASGYAKQEPFGLGTKPVLLVVDAYYGAVGDERLPLLESIERWPLSCGQRGWDAIDRIAELVAVARANDVPVVYTKDIENFPSPWVTRPSHAAPDRMSAHDRAKAGQIVDELKPAATDLVIEKASPSGFNGTPLLAHLNYLGVDTIVACGESTSGCVRATVVDGATHRFRMAVVADCCFDRTEAAHAMNLFDMGHKYADVIDSQGAARYMSKAALAP
jgi:maleamate amidohydrolase